MAAPNSRTIQYDNINTFTESVVLPELRDTIFNSNELQKMLDAKKRRLSGGTFIRQPLLYGEGPATFFDGRSPIDISEAEQFTAALFQYRWAAAAGSISAADEAMNSGEAETMSLIQNRYKVMVKSFQNLIGQGIHSAGTAPNEIAGLQTAVAGSGSTYGGISGTTYSWWRSVVTDMTGTPLSDSNLNDFIQDLTEGADAPGVFVCDKNTYGIIYNVVSPLKRIFNKDDRGSIGFSNVDIQGKPVVVDSHCAASTLYALNMDYLELVVHSMWDMKFIPWQNWTNPFMKSSYFVSSLQMINSNRRFQGKMTNLTA